MSNNLKLSTSVTIPNPKHTIDCSDRIFSIGSCFSDHIGSKLQTHGFQCLLNPFGTIYNPLSIEKLLQRSVDLDLVVSSEILAKEETYFHYDFHSMFSSIDKDKTINQINESLHAAHQFIKEARWIIITLGTAYVYELKESSQIVANCHKMPADLFDKHLVDIPEIEQSLAHIKSNLLSLNPNLRIILTVSPVRHLRDGLIDNNRSKARLIECCHRSLDHKTYYFPSYEIMMDELRDYRYYDRDLSHPNELAIDIIWNKFINNCMSNDSIEMINTTNKINRSINHRPFHHKTTAHLQFLENLESAILNCKNRFPHIDQYDEYLENPLGLR